MPDRIPPVPTAQPSQSVHVDWSEIEAAQTAQEPHSEADLPETFTGPVGLIFLPCPDSQQVGSFWEILESIDGVEGVTGASALDGGLGFECSPKTPH